MAIKTQISPVGVNFRFSGCEPASTSSTGSDPKVNWRKSSANGSSV